MKMIFKLMLIPCLFFSAICFSQTTIGLIQHVAGSLEDGYVLFAPITSTKTYLIDKCGNKMKTWNSTYRPGQSCYILPDGTLLRSGNANNTTFSAGGKGGIIEKIDWNDNVVWTFTISSTTECQHHDIRPLPNGNILAIVWDLKTDTEAIAQGRNPALTTATVWSEKIIEIQPTGSSGGTIVWEWHLWDHLIQDFDNSKPNFGTISSNPQLINLNYDASANATNGQDWIHMNSIDYNSSLDQILVSSHSFNEIWVIDHSTSTTQAASHIGGNSSKGGDLLYRWGNPQAYSNGTLADQRFFGQHNAQWINSGLPYQDQIMVFNNGNNRNGGNYSTVEIINPPVNGNNYTTTLPYLPATNSWIYNDGNPDSFYAQNISGAQQLSNGNVMICNGPVGTFFEINTTGEKLWEYINPAGTTVMTQGATPAQNSVFRATFYPLDYSGFVGKTLTAAGTIENTNTNSLTCELSLSVETKENEIVDVVLFPNPSSQQVTVQFLDDISADFDLEIIDELGKVRISAQNLNPNTANTFDVSSLTKGVYFVLLKSVDKVISKRIVIE